MTQDEKALVMERISRVYPELTVTQDYHLRPETDGSTRLVWTAKGTKGHPSATDILAMSEADIPAEVKYLTSGQLFAKFTTAEKIAFAQSAAMDTELRVVEMELSAVDYAFPTTSPTLISMLDTLVAKSVITEARKIEVLS